MSGRWLARWLLPLVLSGCSVPGSPPGRESRATPRAKPSAERLASAPTPVPAPAPVPPPHASGVPRPIPNPLVSRNKPAFAHSLAEYAEAKPINDGVFGTFDGAFRAGRPTPDKPAWVAIKVGGGYRRVLFVWSESGSPDYDNTTYGSPAAYSVQVSADSTNGADGSWRTVASVENNRYHSREHAFDFDGQSWVKMLLLRTPQESPGGVGLDEIEVHDLSAGGTDTWFFAGDSITAQAFRRNTEGAASFDRLVNDAVPRHRPAIINGGIGFLTAARALEHIDEWLRINPDFKYWALGYGTNDSAGNDDTEQYAKNLQALIDRIKAQNRIPIVPRIPFAADDQHPNLPKFNEVVDRLAALNHLLPGPDLYAWFRAHPEELRDKLHPDQKGAGAINRLWWEAVRGLYQP